MTELAIRYIANPFSGLWNWIVLTAEIIGYSRAAAELARQGLHKEAKACILQAGVLRKERGR